MITFFKDKKLFESTTYFTAQPLDEFVTDAEAEVWNDVVQKKASRYNSDFPYLDTSSLPRYVPQPVTLAGGVQEALGHLSVLLGLIVVLLIGTIVSFMKYDVR